MIIFSVYFDIYADFSSLHYFVTASVHYHRTFRFDLIQVLFIIRIFLYDFISEALQKP